MPDIGIDTGGTTTRILSTEGYSEHFQTPPDYQSYLDALSGIIESFGYVRNIVVALPSKIEGQEVINPPNLDASWKNSDLVTDLRSKCTKVTGHIRLVQDTEAAAFEMVSRGFINRFPALALTLSTGVGGAIVWENYIKPLEIGHAVLNLGGENVICGCGQNGCVEADLSGAGILRAHGVLPEEADDSFWREYGTMFGRFLLVFVPVFCAKTVMLFGGLSNQAERFLPTTRSVLKDKLLRCQMPDIAVCNQQNEIGAYGARRLAEQLVEK